MTLLTEVLSFDVVPAFADGEAYEIPDDRQGVWIGTNPESHASLATEANKALSGQWKPLIKMIKKWNDHNESPVESSFLLEVMGLALIHPPWGGSYPYELKQFFASAANRIDEGWPDPAKVGPDVSDVLDSDSSKMELARRALANRREQFVVHTGFELALFRFCSACEHNARQHHDISRHLE